MTIATSETLAARLRRGPLAVREAVQMCRALLTALEAAHARGVAHGSISSSTITLENGRPVLGAFTAPATAAAGDIYAVGAVLYESLTGRSWTAETTAASPDWAGVPRRLRRVLRRALHPVPEKRWPDAASFQRGLWAPRPQATIWPAVVVLALGALIITGIVFCKPLGLCWERPAGQQVPPPR